MRRAFPSRQPFPTLYHSPIFHCVAFGTVYHYVYLLYWRADFLVSLTFACLSYPLSSDVWIFLQGFRTRQYTFLLYFNSRNAYHFYTFIPIIIPPVVNLFFSSPCLQAFLVSFFDA